MTKVEARQEHSPIYHRPVQRKGRAMILLGGLLMLTLLGISCESKISTSTITPTCDARATVIAEVAEAERIMTQLVEGGREDVARQLAAAMTEKPSENYACKPTMTEQSGVIFQTETSTPVPAFKQTGVALTMDAILATLTPLDYTNYTPAPGIEETMWAVRGDILTSTAKAEVTSKP